MKKPILFSFFSGSGFLDLGFELNGFDVQFVNELHPPFLDAYQYSRKKLNLSSPRFGFDSRSIDELVHGAGFGDLLAKVEDAKSSGGLVGFIGGPPCPDFSVAGKNKGSEGDHGRLTKVYVDGILKFKPDFFVFENVKGLWRTARHREFYEQIKSMLIDAGYSLSDRLSNSIEFGAPQDRDRIILFGVKKDTFNLTGESDFSSYLNWDKYVKFTRDNVFSLKSWPIQSEYKENIKTIINNDLLPFKELTVEHWFEKNDVDNHPNSKHYFTPRAALDKFKTINEGDVSKKSFKRLHRWRYSPTAAYGNNEVHIHPYKSRRISAAEALAIQSLPKDFCFPDYMTLSNMFKTIGNGVPFLLSSAMAKVLLDFFRKSKK